MAAVLEVEDDVFFADLSHQISLLLMDDDEGSLAHCSSVNLQASTQAITSATQTSRDQTSRIERKGTGVFIPRSLHSSRNNRHGRFTANSRIKFQRDSDNSRGLHHVANFSNKNSTYKEKDCVRYGEVSPKVCASPVIQLYD